MFLNRSIDLMFCSQLLQLLLGNKCTKKFSVLWGGALGFLVLQYWLFFRFFRSVYLVLVFTAVYDFSVLKNMVFTLVKNTHGFSDLVSDVVFSFTHMGSGFSLI